VTQSALICAPSVKAEVDALRAEEERDEALAAYVHHHPLSDLAAHRDARSFIRRSVGRIDFFDGAHVLVQSCDNATRRVSPAGRVGRLDVGWVKTYGPLWP